MHLAQLIALALTSCDSKDTTFSDLDSGLGTGSSDPGETFECHEQSASARFDLDGDGSWDDCSTYNSDISIIDASGAYMKFATIYGNEPTIPGSAVPIDVWGLVVPPPSSGGTGATYPYDQVMSSDMSANEMDRDLLGGFYWYAGVSGTELDALNDCAPYCSFFAIGTEIRDPLTALADSCSFYDDDDAGPSGTGLDVCITWDYVSDEPLPPPDAGCTAGSGRFHLVPFRYQDADGDGKLSALLRAVQETGRGTMTGGAQITRVSIVDDHGIGLKVMHKDQTFSFGDDDSLVATRGGTSTVSDRRTTRFTRGQLTGGAPFVAEGYPMGEALDIEADIAWTCPAASHAGTADTLPQGYTLALSDIGCPYAQRVTFRPVLNGGIEYAQLELYGMRNNTVTVPLLENDDRRYFDYEERGFDIEGSFALSGGKADLTFDRIAFLGVDQCTIGTYSIAREQ